MLWLGIKHDDGALTTDALTTNQSRHDDAHDAWPPTVLWRFRVEGVDVSEVNPMSIEWWNAPAVGWSKKFQKISKISKSRNLNLLKSYFYCLRLTPVVVVAEMPAEVMVVMVEHMPHEMVKMVHVVYNVMVRVVRVVKMVHVVMVVHNRVVVRVVRVMVVHNRVVVRVVRVVMHMVMVAHMMMKQMHRQVNVRMVDHMHVVMMKNVTQNVSN
jgi:hypothetical protein